MKTNSFKKDERLCSKTLINELFLNGKAFNFKPFRIIRLNADLDNNVRCKLLITVPSAKIKKAVDRNRLKRLIREAFRKNKLSLYNFLNENSLQLVFGILYNSKELMTYSEIEMKIILILQRLQNELKIDNERSLN